MTFDLRRSLRRVKPHRFTWPLQRRRREALHFVAEFPTPGRDLLLDTCVYIDVMQGRTPARVDALLQIRTLNHLSVCIAELTHAFGQLDPRHPGSATALRILAQTINDVPPHRLAVPNATVAIEAGILAGLIYRLGDFAVGQELAALNDATLYLHAAANGQAVLTRNVRDFDMINQILPVAQPMFYDRIE